MNETEQYIFNVITKRKGYPLIAENITTKYYRENNFVSCIVSDVDKEAVGTAKRHPRDRFVFSIGQKIAFSKAIKNLIKEKMPKVTREIKTYKLAEKLNECFDPTI